MTAERRRRGGSWLEQRFPLVRLLRRGYPRELLRGDVTAGLTTAVMLIPQAMAYAALAGMPPITGLYASVVPIAVYALLGTSGALAFGPVAIVSLLTASAVGPLAGGDPATYVVLAGALALMVGAIQLLLGVLRLGGGRPAVALGDQRLHLRRGAGDRRQPAPGAHRASRWRAARPSSPS
jgi:sulfate permease, SulP family